MDAPLQSSTAPILVTGGTGTLGRQVVARLREAGRDMRVLSRGRGPGLHVTGGVEYVIGDLATGDGVGAAVAGTETVVHCAGSARGDETKAANLVAAALGAETRHIVFISVVGADRIPVRGRVDRTLFGYFASKLAAEHVIADSGVPWSIVRATQFHELTLKTLEAMARMPVIPVPSGWRVQPIAAAEVAERLVDLAQGVPSGLVAEIGGPRVYPFADLIRGYLRAVGKRRLIIPLPLPGEAARTFLRGPNLTQHAVGRTTWEEFLAARVQRASTSEPSVRGKAFTTPEGGTRRP